MERSLAKKVSVQPTTCADAEDIVAAIGRLVLPSIQEVQELIETIPSLSSKELQKILKALDGRREEMSVELNRLCRELVGEMLAKPKIVRK